MRKSTATIKPKANRGRSVAVIGGGIGGLTSAIAFARSGAQVTLHEKAAELREYGAGLQITPNGRRALDALGIDVGPIGLRAEAVIPMDGLSGRKLATLRVGDQKPGYLFVHRGDLLHLLGKQAGEAGVEIKLSSGIDFARNLAGLQVAADGLHSSHRSRINKDPLPRFSNQVAWRAVIEAEDEPVARIWMLPGAHIVTYPMTARRMNVVAIREQDEWVSEGWSVKGRPENLQDAFAHVCNDLRDILEKVREVHLWGLFLRPVARSWFQQDTVLLGDAAHPTLPFLAQGANLAVEDAYVLARCCNDTEDQTIALERYQAIRRPRVTRAIEAANANARNYHHRGLNRVAAHAGIFLLGALAPNLLINRLSWLYDHDVTAPPPD